VLVAEDEAGALQEDRGDLFFTTSVENREPPLYRALSAPEANLLQAQYIAWLALPEECRSLRTEVALACKLGVNRTTLWRWKQDPHLRINECAGGSPAIISSHLPGVSE
jgi:hypothetical protein